MPIQLQDAQGVDLVAYAGEICFWLSICLRDLSFRILMSYDDFALVIIYKVERGT